MEEESKAISIEESFVQSAAQCSVLRLGKDEVLESILFDMPVEEAFGIEAGGIQSSCSVVNVRKARLLSSYLINEAGELQLPRVRLAKDLLEKRLYSFGFGAEEARIRDQRLLRMLTFLYENVEAQRLIKKLSRPLVNRLAEEAIRDTLLLPDNEAVTDTHARRAVLAALCTTLRQSLGSCFATAPAIMVHDEQPLLFLHDLDDLIGTAKLKRTVAGNEYSVPMSSSWGQGDLKKSFGLTAPLSSSPPIWRSSSLIQALQSIGLIPETVPREEGYSILYGLLEKEYARRLTPGEWTLSTVDDVLKRLILRFVGLSEAELTEYENRPKAMMQTAMVVSAPQLSGVRAEKEKLFSRFYMLFAKAQKTFIAEADCALLKSWEFTIASFAEVKFDLARWNFYSSLGVNWDDVGGIGQVLYDIAKKKVDETNLELEEYRQRYEAISVETDYLARRLQSASTEDEIRWMKMEFQTRQAEQYHIKQVWDMMVEKANRVAGLHQFLIDSYDRLMKEYFQEVYDADLHDVQAGPFDDAPAGFRLIYKHGRTNPSLWTKIISLSEYIDALVSFFTMTEQELLHAPEIKGIEAEFSSIITRLATHVRSDEFIVSALNRTARAHGVAPIADPLHNLDRIEKKPWVFTSGGNMNTLVSSYFGLDGQPEEAGRWVESDTELAAFLIDTARQANTISGRFKPTSVLMHSPTHAFTLLPTVRPFEESIAGDTYSYSWLTNHIKDPGLLFYSTCVYDPAAVGAFCELLSKRLPPSIRTRFLNEAPTIPGFLRPYELAKEIEKLFSLDIVLRHAQAILEEISLPTLLFESSPYTGPDILRDVVTEVLTAVLPKEKRKNGAEQAIHTATTAINRPLRAKELLYLFKMLMVRLVGSSRCEKDILHNLVETLRGKKLLPPQPLIVADSNWVKDYFAFLVSPTSQQIEMWAVNAYGTEGRPIPSWRPWLDGSRREPTWGVLVNPIQYLMGSRITTPPSVRRRLNSN
jgi:hypothetical protein